MKEKLYFTSIDSTTCHSLDWFDDEELEELEYTLIEAVPDDGASGFIWCTYVGETTEKHDCKKSVCTYYSSKSGRGVCEHRGSLYWHGQEVNVKKLHESLNNL